MPVSVGLQAFHPATKFVSVDRKVASNSGTFHTADVVYHADFTTIEERICH